jgi:hypothetical protein
MLAAAYIGRWILARHDPCALRLAISLLADKRRAGLENSLHVSDGWATAKSERQMSSITRRCALPRENIFLFF